MDTFVNELEELTMDLLSKLEQAGYEEITEFVEQREAIIKNINQLILEQSISDEKKYKLESLLMHDDIIINRMRFLKNEASDWLSQRKQAIRKRSAYEVSYSTDSFFVDKQN